MPASKRLIVCCDGTWNDADEGINFTNVVRIARAIEPIDARSGSAIPQIIYYHSGVGTGGDLIDRVAGGGVGMGLSRNVRDGYAFLANNYCDGDEIFLFGFSRGAYTARSIAGLIGFAGLLHKRDMDDFALLWEGYRLKDNDEHRTDVLQQFPDRHQIVPIRFVGVWDTVGALGIPGHLDQLFKDFYEFHDTNLGTHVQFAYQALALDEHRKDFEPAIWKQSDGVHGQVLEQVWFAGAHSNVGGGYDEHGLSDIALAWMAAKVAPLLSLDVEGYLNPKRDMRNLWACGRLYDSADGEWKLRPRINRRPLDPAIVAKTKELIHTSVITRQQSGAAAIPGAYVSPSLDAVVLDAQTVVQLEALEQTLKWTQTIAAPPGAVRPSPNFLSRVLNIFGGG
jgi:uncharacterized protein (DUF2235 family)